MKIRICIAVAMTEDGPIFEFYGSDDMEDALALSLAEERLANAGYTATHRYIVEADLPEMEVQVVRGTVVEGDTPGLESLCGIAPDCTEGLPSEEYVRRLRDEWDQE